MSVLVVGLSYRTAPLDLLERAALGAPAARALEERLCRSDSVAEAVVLATCNRLEIYAEVSKFHGGVADVGAGLAAAGGVGLTDLTDHLYVHYEAAAVTHLFTVAAGLDSMAVGEQQILSQVRSTLRAAQKGGSVARVLGHLLQVALRVGKRAHSETGLDRVAGSLVEAGIARSEQAVGPLAGASVLVVGAGSMSGLAVATMARHGVGRLAVANRTPERARRLAATGGGTAVPMADLAAALVEADVVVSCTGAAGHVVTADLAATVAAARGGRPQAYVDLALPRDVDPAAARVDGVTVFDLEALGRHLAGHEVAAEVAQVREIVLDEVRSYLAEQRAQAVAPTVVALRAHARSVVEAELARLQQRVHVDPAVRAELEQTVHRVVEKLLHNPTVRVKELAGEPGGSAYADALRELFGLDLGRVTAVTERTVPGPGPGLSLPAPTLPPNLPAPNLPAPNLPAPNLPAPNLPPNLPARSNGGLLP